MLKFTPRNIYIFHCLIVIISKNNILKKDQMDVDQIKNLERLLKKFNRIGKLEEVLPTYLDISGFPNLENVASNILAFFLNTNGKHGLQDLLLKSLLQTIKLESIDSMNLNVVNYYREYVIDERKRIDLIILGENFCINIENKLFHHLNNDLLLYEKEVNRKFKKDKNIHIVLSLKKENVVGSFISITYEEFFDKIKANIGYYSLKANKIYLNYLLDFIQTIESHYKMEEINKEMFSFLVENEQELNELEIEKRKLSEALLRTLNQVKNHVGFEADNVKQWVYNKNFLVYDFTIGDSVIAVNIVFEYTKVSMFIGGRSLKARTLLDKLAIKRNNEHVFRRNEHLIVFEDRINFFDIPMEEYGEKIKNYLSQVYVAEFTNPEILN